MTSKRHRALFIGRGGAAFGMGHLVRLDALIQEFTHDFEVSIAASLDNHGQFFLKRRRIDFFAYRGERELSSYLSRIPRFDIIVVDVYPPDRRLLAAVRNHGDHLLCFDDMGKVADENIARVYLCPQETFKRKIISRLNSSVIMGSDFFPLRPDIINSRKNKRWNGRVKDIAIVLGGAPQIKKNLNLIRLLDRLIDNSVTFHVVSGFEQTPSTRVSFSTRINSLNNVDTMGDLISRMDMGIIAGGFVKFEFMCIGTPFAMVSLSSHQEVLTRKFSARGYGDDWGPVEGCLADPEKLQEKAVAFIADEKKRAVMFARSRRLVDGLGSCRILRLAKGLIQGEKIK